MGWWFQCVAGGTGSVPLSAVKEHSSSLNAYSCTNQYNKKYIQSSNIHVHARDQYLLDQLTRWRIAGWYCGPTHP